VSGQRAGFWIVRAAAAATLSAGMVLAASPATAAPAPAWELRAMSVPAAWPTSQGAGVTVAVIDSGIRVDHKVLAGRAKEGPDLLRENDKDQPYYGRHGTAMASHVLDVAPKATVLGLRAIRDDEDPKKKEPASTSPGARSNEPPDPVADAIFAAIDAHVGVISMSLGDEALAIIKFSQAQAAGISMAVSKGIVVVAAAGNAGDETNDVSFPANYPGVIAVGAAAPSGKRAAFSQVHSYVDLLAPGQEVNAADVASGGRSKIQGTSSATALTSGVAALIKSAHPDLAPRQVEEAMVRAASHYKKGHDAQTGYGRINAAAALKEAAALKPEPAQVAVARYAGPDHLGPGDDGTLPWINQALDPEYFVIGGIAAGIGLIGMVVGVLLFVSGRRAARRTAAVPAGAGPTGGAPRPR
jgi:subtilisin family serine protease